MDESAVVDRLALTPVRWLFWKTMIAAIFASPWFGYGWGQITSAQILTTLDSPALHLMFESSHNLFIDLVLWNGLPVGLTISAGLLIWFSRQIRVCRDPASFSLLLGVCFVFNHAMVEYPLNYAYFLLPVGFMMGVLSAMHPGRFDVTLTPVLSRVFKPITMVIGAGTLALFTLVVVEYFPIEEDWRLMQFQQARIGDWTPTAAPESVVLTGLSEFLRFSRTDASPAMSAQQIDWMRRVSERYAYGAPMYKYALALALNDRSGDAQLALRRLCSMQRASACKSAKQDWEELTQKRFPQLAATPFPAMAAQP
jgi:hypothetical protein